MKRALKYLLVSLSAFIISSSAFATTTGTDDGANSSRCRVIKWNTDCASYEVTFINYSIPASEQPTLSVNAKEKPEEEECIEIKIKCSNGGFIMAKLCGKDRKDAAHKIIEIQC